VLWRGIDSTHTFGDVDMKFGNWNRPELVKALQNRGWSRLAKSVQNIAGQLHQWYIPSPIRGHIPKKYTLQNAARIARLID
jgi:hypothetical protein